MVCAKCQKVLKTTQLATPGVKRKTDLYYGSPAAGGSSSTSAERAKARGSTTIGSAGVSKSKLLGKNAKNPYAAYSSSCRTCKTRTEQGRALCNSCAYRANACSMCGKGQSKTKSAGGGPVVEGQKFSSK